MANIKDTPSTIGNTSSVELVETNYDLLKDLPVYKSKQKESITTTQGISKLKEFYPNAMPIVEITPITNSLKKLSMILVTSVILNLDQVRILLSKLLGLKNKLSINIITSVTLSFLVYILFIK